MWGVTDCESCQLLVLIGVAGSEDKWRDRDELHVYPCFRRFAKRALRVLPLPSSNNRVYE